MRATTGSGTDSPTLGGLCSDFCWSFLPILSFFRFSETTPTRRDAASRHSLEVGATGCFTLFVRSCRREMPLFGFDWSAGYVSPWQAADGSLFATPPPVVDAIVDSLQAGEAPMVELGSGDGRICIAAARRGVRCVGIELDPMLVAEASRAAEGLALVRFECADALTAALPAGATVVSYLLPAALAKIVPGLAARGARRMLSVRWACEFAEWRPLRMLSVVADDGETWRVHECAQAG